MDETDIDLWTETGWFYRKSSDPVFTIFILPECHEF